MDIQQITEFITLADKLDYALAAKKLFITEAELSEDITQLEEEIGTAMFINNARGEMTITEFGRIFLQGAKRIEHAYGNTISDINKAKGKPQRTLRIGYRYDASRDEMPYITRALGIYAPTIKPVYTPLEHMELREKLENGEIDVAIGIVVEDRLYDGYNTICIDKDVYELVAPKNHPFAVREAVTLKEIAEENVIIPSPTTMASMNMFFTNIFKDAGVDMVQSAYYDDVPGLVMQIEEGEGVSMVLSQRRSHFDDRVAFVPIADELPGARVNLIWAEATEQRIPGDWLKAFDAMKVEE